MSQLSYNGVEITHIHTQKVSETPVRTDDGSDSMYRRVEVRVSGIIGKYPLTPALGGETATGAYTRVRELLWIPRKQLLFTVNSEVLVRSPVPGRTLDAKNGPVPIDVVITRIDGSEVLHVDFAVETFLTCQDITTDNVVSNRWTETSEINEVGMTTWTRHGKLFCRSDLFAANADDLRSLILPPLRNGFRRLRSSYTIQADGLALAYEIVDKEEPVGPPAPAFVAEGEVTVSAMNAATRYGEVRVRLRGNYYSSVDQQRTPAALVDGKAGLLKTAVSVAMFQLGKLDILGRNQITAAAVRTSLYENDAEVRVKAMLAPSKSRNEGLAASMDGLTGPPLYSDSVSGDPGDRGSAGLSLLAAPLKDPCLIPVTMKDVGPGTDSLAAGNPDYEPAEIDFTDVIPDDNLGEYRVEDVTGFWTSYTITKNYRMDPGVHQLPIAQDVGSGFNTSVFVQTHPKQAQLNTDWIAERVGSRPTFPSTDLQDGGNSILVSADILTEELETSGDGVTKVWKVKGRYVHGFKDSSKAQVTWGTPPYRDAVSGATMTAVPADLTAGIIDPYGGASQTTTSILTSL